MNRLCDKSTQPMETSRYGRADEDSNWRVIRKESTKDHRFIKVSEDEKSLDYCRLGTEDFGKPALVEEVVKNRKLVGGYSENSEKKVVMDRSRISFLLPMYLPNSVTKQKLVDIDLDSYQFKGKHYYTASPREDFYNFLAWISNNKDIFKEEMEPDVDLLGRGRFVMLKNSLSAFLATPSQYENEWTFYACSIKDIIYLLKDSDVYYDQRGLWSRKFQQILTQAEDTANNGYDFNEEFRAVLSSTMGCHKLFYSLSAGFADPEKYNNTFSDLAAFITLRCFKEADDFSYRFKMMYSYFDYILSGVQNVLIGQRTEGGKVVRLKLYDSTEMLKIGKIYWNTTNCVTFATELLSFIKSKVDADPGAVYSFKKASRIAKVICCKESEMDNFVPDWFLQKMNRTSEN